MSERNREASVATLRRLAETLDEYGREMRVFEGPYMSTETTYSKVGKALAAYRSEIAPLPARWRVGTRVPEHVYLDDKPICTMPSADLARAVVAAMNSGPSSADAEEVPSPRPPASPAGADYSRLTPVEREYIEYHADAPVPAPVMDAIRAAYPRVTASGPPGAVAAKESRDNAAAPEGAAKPLASPGLYAWKRVPRALWESLGHELTHDDRYHHLRPDLIKAIQAVLTVAHSTSVREEEEGATMEDPEPCGCEHTEALLVRLRRIHEICDVHASIDGDRQLEIWRLSDV